jgi:hypothetical protein
MKKLIIASMSVVAALASLPAHALTATGAFDVQVNLYPKCEVTIAASPLVLNYVSFQTSASTNTMAAGIKCTNTLPYSLSIAGTSGASGTLVGLPYTLAVPAGGTGNGASQSINVTGTIAANEGGNCSQANAGTAGTQTAAVTGTSTGLGTACQGTSAAGAHILTVTY